jgi:hypothetical protein
MRIGLYSLNNAKPAPLPQHVIIDGIGTRTSLADETAHTDAQITAYGFAPAPDPATTEDAWTGSAWVTPPSYDPDTEIRTFDGSAWSVTAMTAAQLAARAEAEAMRVAGEARADLAASDMDMVRVVEDLIDVLDAAGVLARSALPQAVQDKLAARATARAKL